LVLVVSIVLILPVLIRKSAQDEKSLIDPSITFCIVPYLKISKELYRTYMLSMASWLDTSNHSQILILWDENSFDTNGSLIQSLKNQYGNDRIRFLSNIEVDEDNIPYINDWFLKGFDNTNTNYICFINSDIILPLGWYTRVKYLYNFFSRQEKQHAIVSRRCDIDLNTNTFHLNIEDYQRKTHSKWGVDFYLISLYPMHLNIDDIPPFHMGKYRWDPWITGWLNAHIDVVSFGDEFCTYHINHKPKERDMSDIKVKENFELAAKNNRYNGANHLTKYYLKKNKLCKRNGRVLTQINAKLSYNSPIDLDEKKSTLLFE